MGGRVSDHIKASKGLVHAQAVFYKDLILPSIFWCHLLDGESCGVAANIIINTAERRETKF